jgi:hypothetical protein
MLYFSSLILNRTLIPTFKSLTGLSALNQNVNFKIKNIDAEGEFATIKTTRQTGGYDIRL